MDPPLEFYQIDNMVESGSPKKIAIGREPGSRQLRIWGTLPPKDPGLSEILAIHDPALYAAVALRDALTRRGVAIRSGAIARHSLPGAPVGPTTGFYPALLDSLPPLEEFGVTAE